MAGSLPWRLALFALFALATPRAVARPRIYALDPGRSQLTIHVGKAGAFGFAGHEHEVVARSFHGTATFNPERIAQSAVDLTFEAGALRVVNRGEPSGDAAQVQAAMVGPSCLDAQRFPTVHFVSKTVTASGAARSAGQDLSLDLDLRGDLTVHGVTRPLAFRVHVDVRGEALDAVGSTTIRQTDFGITPISKAGVVKVKDDLALSWHIRGTTR